MGGDWLTQINQLCTQLLSSKSDVFVSFGINMVQSLAVIRLLLFGIGCMLRAADPHAPGMDWGGFIRHILVIGTAFTLIRGYSQPIAMIGQSFPDVIMEGPQYLAHQIGDDSYKQIDTLFATIRKNNPPSSLLNIETALSTWSSDLLLILCQAIMCIVMSYGYIASAVCALVGPIFVPFLLFEPLSFMFWGWFKTFLQYAFYPVVGAAYTHIFASLLVNTMSANSASATLANLAALLPLIVITILGMLQAPKMCAALFSGSGGDHGSLIGAATKLAAMK